MNRIGITIGDPAGVGPELVIKLSQSFDPQNAYVLYGEEKILLEAADLVGMEIDYKKIDTAQEVKSPGVYLIDLGVCEVSRPEPSLTSGKLAVVYLARAVVDAVNGNVDGLLTMPINKFWARRVGFSYEGQTEYLAQATSTREFAMMLYSERLKVVLLTTHVPLSEVPRRVKKEEVVSKVKLIVREFERLFKREPSVGVLGLNPHAGEGGEIGQEEVREIEPAISELKNMGLKVEGPLVPDTAFLKAEDFDVFLCMYHDQGLIPFKMLSFREGVNVTLGIPFPRTSPDHGTAYDIAWKGTADVSSSRKALELLEKILQNLKS